MEQKFGVSGLQNLDPLRYWQYVMAKSRQHPSVVISGYIPKELGTWTQEYPQINFVVEGDMISEELSDFLPNVNYRWMKRMTHKEWLERWNWVDYVLCDESVPEYWVQAQLCGVSPIFNEKKLADELRNVDVLDSVSRITNWELARAYLDTKK